MSGGFYKLDGVELIGGRRIFGPGYSMDVDNPDDRLHPRQGWQWFASIDEAKSVLGYIEKPLGFEEAQRRSRLLKPTI